MAKKDKVIAAMAAQDAFCEQLLQSQNVIGLGTGFRIKKGKITREVCVQVLVHRKRPLSQLAAKDVVPKELAGPDGNVKTDVLEISVDAQPPDTNRYRPVHAGCSIGPESSVSAGTLGGWACDNTDDTTILITNNHVISNLDTMPVLRRVVQPGRLDGGLLPGDVIGSLKRDVTVNTVPFVPGGGIPAPSVVDAAISTIDEESDDLLDLNVPVIYEIQAPALGMDVQKRGRTTRLTTNGTITTINTTIDITYRSRTRLGRVQNSFIITSTDGNMFSDSGDSGSLILNQTTGELEGTFPVVGLLYGGGENADGTPITVANDINAVFGALNLTTICDCVARAVIRAAFGSQSVGAELRSPDYRYFLSHKERQLRKLRNALRDSGRFGGAIEMLIRKETARVGKVITQDEEAFGLLVRALRPFVAQATNLDVMDMPLERDNLDNLLKFAKRVSGKSRAVKPQIAGAAMIARAIEGKTLGQVLRSTSYNLKTGTGSRGKKKAKR